MSSQLPMTAVPETGQRGVRVTWWYTVISMVFVLFVTYALVLLELLVNRSPADWRDWLLLVFLLASLLAVTRYCWLLRAGLGSGLPATRYQVMVLLPAVLMVVFASFNVPHTLLLLIPAWWSVIFITALLPRHRLLFLVLGAVAMVLLRLLVGSLSEADPSRLLKLDDEGQVFYFFFSAVITPIVVFFSLWWWDIVVQLDRSRKAFAELSVTRERLRFAADLHDIQGHHLQVIALKTELAERLLERDPATARQQIHEAQVLARTALEDTRALVRGYRKVAFSTELKNAAEVFEAASIKAVVLDESAELSSEQGTLLGLLMREASTNILRHSRATAVRISLGVEGAYLVLKVSNDGIAEAPISVLREGTGLLVLKERFEAAGGSLEAEKTEGHFTVTAKLPEA
ncbi:sensor histidine kinase [Psychromicrobium sp. YIM B11713]|uniref:sensor histidine kinase n=1 Tax=Psychromicrobium sp. YIM B11713 TaxID=3145233 RepID=UPI00374E2130